MTSRTQIGLRTIGLAGVNPFIIHNSSPRAVMDFSHMSSRVSLVDPDKKLVLTGIEHELGKYINDVRTEHDVVIKGIVQKNRELGTMNPETILLVEFEKNGELWLDMIELPNTRSTHNFFGYTIEPTDEAMGLHYNSHIPKGTVLGKTASYGEDGTYKTGINANIALMSHPSVAEDGFAVSESFIEKGKFTAVSKRVIYLTKDNIPLNLYGDGNNFKMFPEIGEAVRPDGLLCGTRERSDWFSIADLNNESISEIDQTFDTPVYVPPGSIVTDIRVHKGDYSKTEYTEEMSKQLDAHAENEINFADALVKQYDTIVAEHKRRFNDKVKVRQTPRLIRRVTDALIIRETESKRNRLCYRKINIDQYRVEITVLTVIKPNLGFKYSDLSA